VHFLFELFGFGEGPSKIDERFLAGEGYGCRDWGAVVAQGVPVDRIAHLGSDCSISGSSFRTAEEVSSTGGFCEFL